MNQGMLVCWVAQARKGMKSAEFVAGVASAAELAAGGIVAGQDRIARLRREEGIHCIQKRKFKATTHSNHSLPVADNLLNQVFKPCKPDEVWVSDITCISTEEGWLYLAGIKDVFACEIVGYAMGARMTQELVSQALQKAVKWKKPAAGLILHSDRGRPVLFTRRSQAGGAVWSACLHVAAGQLLRQRPDGELLGQPEERTGTPSPLQ